MINTLSRKKQIEQLASKLSSVGYSIRSLTSVMSEKSLRTIYYSYVHSTMLYGIIFWGNLSYRNSIFNIQKRIIKVIRNAGYRDSCHPLFKKLNILPLYSQNIFSLPTFAVKNTEAFKLNSAINSINTNKTLTCILQQQI